MIYRPRPLILLGAGGHARVLIDCAHTLGFPVPTKEHFWAALDVLPDNVGKKIDGVLIEHEDELGRKYLKEQVRLVNGVGSTSSMTDRMHLYWMWKNLGWEFAKLVHPKATVSDSAELGEGVQVLAGAIINAGAKIGANTIINTGAVIEHDCVIGESCHIAPTALICGGAKIGSRTHVGAGATVIQGRNIGEACLIAAGSVVTGDVYNATRVAGNPARIMRGQGATRNTVRTELTNVR